MLSQDGDISQETWSAIWIGWIRIPILKLTVISSSNSLWFHPQTHCDVIAALSGQKPLILSLRARFVKYFNKCLENDNNIVKSVAFISNSNPMSCAGNNYRMLLNAKN